MQFTIRRATPADANEVAAVHVAAWEGSYRAIMPREEFEKRPVERRREQWQQLLSSGGHIVLVACDPGGSIAGFAGARLLVPPESRYDSYLGTLYLRPELKGRGLGVSLLKAIASELHARGARNMVLRTLRLNPARSFYEKLGARLVAEGEPIDAGVFDDVVYAFEDLAALIAA